MKAAPRVRREITIPRVISRASRMLLVVLATAGSARHVAAQIPDGAIRLEAVPAAIFKLADPGRGETESWSVIVLVNAGVGRTALRPVRAEVDVLSGNRVMEMQVLSDSTLALLRATAFTVLPTTHPLTLKRLYQRPEVFDLRFDFSARPRAWNTDALRVRLTLEVAGSDTVTRALEIPVRTYVQRTSLVFPLRSNAIVTQGAFNNAGHAGYTNQFAIDVMGLGAQYGPMSGNGSGNRQFAGFGVPVIAPAAGRVVYSRNDVPDTEPGQDAETVYGAQREPLLATAGNAVVIDHGNGEYSVLMHMQRGSVTVVAGDSVSAGQQVGRIGSSGDSFQPHLHYQLQDGPNLFRAATLPMVFSNLPARPLARGEYLSPR